MAQWFKASLSVREALDSISHPGQMKHSVANGCDVSLELCVTQALSRRDWPNLLNDTITASSCL